MPKKTSPKKRKAGVSVEAWGVINKRDGKLQHLTWFTRSAARDGVGRWFKVVRVLITEVKRA